MLNCVRFKQIVFENSVWTYLLNIFEAINFLANVVFKCCAEIACSNVKQLYRALYEVF